MRPPRVRTVRRGSVVAAAIAGLLIAVAACAGATASPSASPGGTAVASLPAGSVTATGAWARPADAGGVSAVYLELHNQGSSDAALVGASTDAASTTTLHETTTKDGMTGMQHASSLAIPAGGTVALEPGGYHLMLEEITAPLAAGSTIDVVLELEDGTTLDVTVEVRAG